jgi:uncharacterized membrane protein YhaH (DUF805 family)
MANPYEKSGTRGEPIATYDKDLDPDLATFQPAVFSIDGRIGRVRYLGYSMIMEFIALLGVGVVAWLVISFAPPEQARKLADVLGIVLAVALSASVIVVTKRRLNDLDRSGWWLLLWFVPLLNVIMALYVMLWPGDRSHNSYGPRPVPNSPGILLLVVVPLMFSILCVIAVYAYVTSLPPGSLPPSLKISPTHRITFP